MNLSKPAPTEDIDFILKKLAELIPQLSFHNEKILMTGGTGFFGKWLTQALLAMNDRWQLGNEITIVSRSRAHALRDLPWLAGRQDVKILEGDIQTLETAEKFTSILHGAAAASQDLNERHPEVMFDTIVNGTRKTLKVAENSRSSRFMFVSSGGVYGPQPNTIDHIPEAYTGAPSTFDPRSAYGEGKRAAELLCVAAQRRTGFRLAVPRCFAFIGPYLPLDIHFAAGNFLKCVHEGTPIIIAGDGTPLRSYLYAADLTIWLLYMWIQAPEKSEPVNVGSGESVSIEALAKTIRDAGKNKNLPIEIKMKADPGTKPARYVPEVLLAKRRYNLEAWTPLAEASVKTLRWLSDEPT